MNAVPESPYKGLASFEDSELDALLFFGRERESEAVTANVLANRLTVLYGPSGVGKSSLLRAGVARRLRELTGAPVVVHDSWAEDPAGGLVAAVRAESGELGATAGLVDTVAAAAQAGGELHLLLDQFEEYLLYHGADGPLGVALPQLLRRPGLRVNILLAVRDDALAELDELAGRIPELFENLLRLDRLDREAGRAAILGPLERYSELTGHRFSAEDELVDAVLDEASTSEERVEAPYLQLVLERLWERERAQGSSVLRLATFREIGGARAVVRDHVQRALAGLAPAEQEAAARVVRQLVTPSGRKLSHEAADLADYADVKEEQLRPLIETLARERIIRGVDGTPGSATRYEIFHEVLGPPILAWQVEHQLQQERTRAQRQRRRLQAVVAAAFAALAVVTALTVFAFLQRSDAQTQARHARGRELAARALAEIPTNPQVSVRLALRAASLAPGAQTAAVLRSSLSAMREQAVLRLGGSIVAAKFAPRGDRLLVASTDGKLALYDRHGRRLALLPRQESPTEAVWGPDGRLFATGSKNGNVAVWRVHEAAKGRLSYQLARTISTGAPVATLALEGRTLLIGSGVRVRLVNLVTGRTRTIRFSGGILAAALDSNGRRFAVSMRHGAGGTSTEILDLRSGREIRALPENGIRSLAFSPNGRLLATGSYDRTARIWNARTGRLLHVLQHHGYVLSERFSADGRSLVTASEDGAAYVWDVSTGQRELLLVGATGIVDAAAFSPDGSEVATASADRLARIYYSQDGRLIAPLAGHGNTVTSIGFDPTGRTIVTGSTDGTVRLWAAQPEGQLTTIDTAKTPVTALFAGTHPVSIAGRRVQILTTSGHLLGSKTMGGPLAAAAARGNTAAVADSTGTLYIFDSSGFRSEIAGQGIEAVAFAGARELLTGSADGTVRAVRLGSAVPRTGRAIRVGSSVLGLSSGGGRFLVRLANQVLVYRDDGTLVSTIDTAAQHAALSPDGETVATTHGVDAQLWDASTGKLLRTLAGHTSLITDVEFSPGGGTLVTASDDHDSRVWSVRTGKTIRLLRGHFFPVRTARYSPGGHWIVTASQFNAGLWNAGDGRLVFYLGRDAAPLTGASFSPSGEWILTGSDDGTARVYRCTICQPLAGLERTAETRLRALR